VPLCCFVGKKVVLGLGERIKIMGSHAAPTEVSTCLKNLPTTKNNAASAHLKTELPVLLGLQSKKFEKKARALNYW
jgi:hypothetical protein